MENNNVENNYNLSSDQIYEISQAILDLAQNENTVTHGFVIDSIVKQLKHCNYDDSNY